MDMAQDRAKLAAKLNIGKEIWYMTREEVVATGLTVTDILALTRDALVAHGRQDYEMPAKIGVHPFQEVFFHAMPAYVPEKRAPGLQVDRVLSQQSGEVRPAPDHRLLLINDVLSGCPLAVMDCAWVTAMRTPAVTVLAAAALHPDAETFGMFGCGVQGVEHVAFARTP